MLLTLTTISPVHIGSGNVLEPFDYYIHNQNLYVLNHEACLQTLYDDHPENVTQFSEWVENTVQKINSAEKDTRNARRSRNRQLAMDKNQLLQKLRREFNIIDFTEKILKKKELAERFIYDKNFWKYSAHIPNRPRGVVQLKEIIKTNGKPFIPGSSIKGAIRTALAFIVIRFLNEEDTRRLLQAQDREGDGLKLLLSKIIAASNEVLSALQNNNRSLQEDAFRKLVSLRRRYEKKAGQHIEKFIFGCDDGKGNIGDPKFDIMRLIKVSDTQSAHFSILAAEMKSFTREGRTGRMKAQPINIAEFIDGDSVFQFRIEVDSKLIRALFNRDNSRSWRGYEEKIERLFGLNKETVNSLSDDEIENEVLHTILKAIKIFGQALAQKEKTWLQQFEPNDRSSLEEFIDSLSQRENAIKLGFASGWFATTVGLAFSQNPILNEILSDILYAFNLDLIIKDEKLLKFPARDGRGAERQIRLLQRKPNAQSFPKSRRLTTERYIPLEYIGWIEIKKGKLDSGQKEQKNTQNDHRDYESIDDALAALKEHFNK